MQNTNQSQKESCCENQCASCKCKVPMIIGAIVFSLATLALGIFLGKTFFSSSPRENSGIPANPTISVVPTTSEVTSGASLENWKTYKNSDFTFKYPANWQNGYSESNIKSTSPKITINAFSAGDGGMMNECMRLAESKTIGNLLVQLFSRVNSGEMCGNPGVDERGLREKWITRAGGNGFAPGLIFKYDISEAKDSDAIFSQILSTFKFTEKMGDKISNDTVQGWKIYEHKKQVNSVFKDFKLHFLSSWELTINDKKIINQEDIPTNFEVIFSLVLAKDQARITIDQRAVGGAGCIYEGDTKENFVSKYEKIRDIVLSNGKTWRISKLLESNSNGEGYRICELESGGVFGAGTDIGFISYKEPKDKNATIVQEMDEMLRKIEILE